MTAFWNANCCNQTDNEVWRINNLDWKATIGLATIRSKVDPATVTPPSFMPNIQAAISATALHAGANWFRHFYCNVGDSSVMAEALKNNELWPEGERVLRDIAWPSPPGQFWSVRSFLVLQPT